MLKPKNQVDEVRPIRRIAYNIHKIEDKAYKIGIQWEYEDKTIANKVFGQKRFKTRYSAEVWAKALVEDMAYCMKLGISTPEIINDILNSI